MTSVMNNSNANSALINTLNSSDSRHNPSVYSSKKIYPAAAVNVLPLDLTTGTLANNNTLTYNLPKYGILQSLHFQYAKQLGGATGSLAAFDFATVIERVELLSSSRVVQTLTKSDILSQVSDLDTSQFNVCNDSFISSKNGNVGDVIFTAVPFVFGFMKDINTNLNLQFNEPMSVRIKLSADVTVANGTATFTISGVPKLVMRYLSYNESDYAEVLSQNYDEPEFNQMVTNFYDEPTVVGTVTAAEKTAKLKTFTIDLKNTECVNNFFIVARKQTASSAVYGAPLELQKMTLKASGQTLFELEGAMVKNHSLCENGFYTTPNNTSSIDNIGKMQIGYWEYAGGGTQSNTLSLRELNNPQIVVEVIIPSAVVATDVIEVIVCEETLGIGSTTSSTGRVQSALSN